MWSVCISLYLRYPEFHCRCCILRPVICMSFPALSVISVTLIFEGSHCSDAFSLVGMATIWFRQSDNVFVAVSLKQPPPFSSCFSWMPLIWAGGQSYKVTHTSYWTWGSSLSTGPHQRVRDMISAHSIGSISVLNYPYHLASSHRQVHCCGLHWPSGRYSFLPYVWTGLAGLYALLSDLHVSLYVRHIPGWLNTITNVISSSLTSTYRVTSSSLHVPSSLSGSGLAPCGFICNFFKSSDTDLCVPNSTSGSTGSQCPVIQLEQHPGVCLSLICSYYNVWKSIQPCSFSLHQHIAKSVMVFICSPTGLVSSAGFVVPVSRNGSLPSPEDLRLHAGRLSSSAYVTVEFQRRSQEESHLFIGFLSICIWFSNCSHPSYHCSPVNVVSHLMSYFATVQCGSVL